MPANEVRSNALTPQYEWDARLGRYRDVTTGRIVSNAQVRAALDQVVLQANARVARVTDELIRGKVSLAEWQMEMARQLKLYHTASAALANGGWAQMTPSDWGRVGAELRTQYQYLQRMAWDIQSGRLPLTRRAILRSQLYTEAMRGTFESERRRRALRKGAREERRVLGVADHCGDCVEYEARGWRPINTLPKIGDSICGARCHCSFEYR